LKEKSYDYIVVGAGSAGCAIAARLAEQPHTSVLLVEAGRDAGSVLLRMPAGIRVLYTSRRYNWRYYTEPQPQLENRRVYIPRGKVVGGSSAINSMIAIRGNPADYDGWAAQGLPGWSYREFLPYLRKIEDSRQACPEPRPDRGRNGPIRIAHGTLRHAISQAFIDSAIATGLPENNGFNNGSQIGAGFYELTISDGQRYGAGRYLDAARADHSLHIASGCLAHRLQIQDGRVQGVVLADRNGQRLVRAEREVVLSAGAIGTPQILLLSGIGPAEHLHQHGIAPLVDLPGVGGNLQDHLDCALRFEASQPITLTPYLGLLKGAIAGARYLLTGGGPAASQGIEAGAFWSLDGHSPVPDHQAHLILALRNPPAGARIAHGFALRICQLRPRSRGHIRLRDANPRSAPLIDPQFLSEAADLDDLRQGVERLREIVRQPALQAYIRRNLDPGAFGDAPALSRWIRAHAETIYHPSGTCRMGVDDMAVVDGELRVRGISNLRVADASIMPDVIRGNTNLPVIAIGEKAADLILRSSAA